MGLDLLHGFFKGFLAEKFFDLYAELNETVQDGFFAIGRQNWGRLRRHGGLGFLFSRLLRRYGFLYGPKRGKLHGLLIRVQPCDLLRIVRSTPVDPFPTQRLTHHFVAKTFSGFDDICAEPVICAGIIGVERANLRAFSLHACQHGWIVQVGNVTHRPRPIYGSRSCTRTTFRPLGGGIISASNLRRLFCDMQIPDIGNFGQRHLLGGSWVVQRDRRVPVGRIELQAQLVQVSLGLESQHWSISTACGDARPSLGEESSRV